MTRRNLIKGFACLVVLAVTNPGIAAPLDELAKLAADIRATKSLSEARAVIDRYYTRVKA